MIVVVTFHGVLLCRIYCNSSFGEAHAKPWMHFYVLWGIPC